MPYKYGISPIIRHPQGTYRVVYASPERTLSNSVLLWFKKHNGTYVKDENPQWTARMKRKLWVK